MKNKSYLDNKKTWYLERVRDELYHWRYAPAPKARFRQMVRAIHLKDKKEGLYTYHEAYCSCVWIMYLHTHPNEDLIRVFNGKRYKYVFDSWYGCTWKKVKEEN